MPGDPVELGTPNGPSHQRRVVVALDHAKYVARHVFLSNILGFSGATNIEAVALAQRVEPQPIMFANHAAI